MHPVPSEKRLLFNIVCVIRRDHKKTISNIFYNDPYMKNIVKLLEIKAVTHDVKCFRMEKPEGYSFTPGQATDVAINKPGYEEEKRPFTFTALNTSLRSTVSLLQWLPTSAAGSTLAPQLLQTRFSMTCKSPIY